MYYTHYHMTQEVAAITSEERTRVSEVLPAVPVLRRNEPKVRRGVVLHAADAARAELVPGQLPPPSSMFSRSRKLCAGWRRQLVNRRGTCPFEPSPRIYVVCFRASQLDGPRVTLSGGLAQRAAVSASSTMATVLSAADRT